MTTLFNLSTNLVPTLHHVPIKELEDGSIKVYRKTLKPVEVLPWIRHRLLQAVECIVNLQALQEGEEITALPVQDLLGYDLEQAGYRAVSPEFDAFHWEGRACEYLKEALALLQFVAGEQVFQSEFSNYLIGK